MNESKTTLVKAAKVDDILYLDVSRNKLLPSYAYYLLEAHGCNYLCFKKSIKLYPKEELKGKESWKDVKHKGEA